MKIIDLSQNLYDKMPTHPYDNEVIVVKNRTIDNDGYNNTQMDIGMHVGTHIDAPSHLIENGKKIYEYSLDYFVGKACVIDVSGKSEIELEDEYKDKIKQNEMILLYTGYGELFNDEKYYATDAPQISKELAEYIAKSGIKIVGIDLPSPDKYPFNIHKILLNNDVLIIENLTNLDKLLDVDKFKFYAFPLNINAEASITRAVAIID